MIDSSDKRFGWNKSLTWKKHYIYNKNFLLQIYIAITCEFVLCVCPSIFITDVRSKELLFVPPFFKSEGQISVNVLLSIIFVKTKCRFIE